MAIVFLKNEYCADILDEFIKDSRVSRRLFLSVSYVLKVFDKLWRIKAGSTNTKFPSCNLQNVKLIERNRDILPMY